MNSPEVCPKCGEKSWSNGVVYICGSEHTGPIGCTLADATFVQSDRCKLTVAKRDLAAANAKLEEIQTALYSDYQWNHERDIAILAILNRKDQP